MPPAKVVARRFLEETNLWDSGSSAAAAVGGDDGAVPLEGEPASRPAFA